MMKLDSCSSTQAVATPDIISQLPQEPLTQEKYDYLLQKLRAQESFYEFIKQAWHIVEPKHPFIDDWHIGALAEHLQAVTAGEIKHLIIGFPPRHTKSLSVSVLWTAWEWGPMNMPWTRWLLTSYTASNTLRDNRRCRKLITSPWYRKRWGKRFNIVDDQNQKIRYDNNHGGYRIASSVSGLGTGEGGDRIVADDPHKVKEAESATERANVTTWWDEEMSSRFNNPNFYAFVIVMQRIHEGDLTGHCLAKDLGYEYLCLPARYEGNRCKTSLGFVDPRTEDGESLSPTRFDDETLEKMEKKAGPYAWAAQYQQRPYPRGGNAFKTDRFNLIKVAPPITKSIRYWDKAGTAGGGAYTAGVKMGMTAEGRFVILDVKRGQWAAPERERRIDMAAELDGIETSIVVEQEGGSGGKESAEATVRRLAGFVVSADRVTGAKEVRAEPYASQVEAGNVDVLNKEWAADFIAEHEAFGPGAKYKDQVDAAAGAFNNLTSSGVEKEYGAW